MGTSSKRLAIGLAMASVVAGTGFVSHTAFAAETVDPSDPVMNCEGPLAPAGFECSIESSTVTGTRVFYLPAEKVTSEVVGCKPNSEGGLDQGVTYEKSATIETGGGVGLNGPMGGLIGDIGASASLSTSNTVSWGQSKTYNVGVIYGEISWGEWSQKMVEATLDMSVHVREPSTDVPASETYSASGVKVNTPVMLGAFPDGSFTPDSRPFSNRAEFDERCGGVTGAVPPPGLG